MLYRVGSFIPIPIIDISRIDEAFGGSASNGLLGMFNLFSGGSLSRLSIFTLSVVPYITSSIIIQVATPGIPYLKSLKSSGREGTIKIYQYTKYLTIFIAFIQSFAIAKSTANLFLDTGMPYNLQILVTCLILTSGVMFLLWLGRQITNSGLGNGISLIIFTGIVAEMPKVIYSLFAMSRAGTLSIQMLLLILVIFVAIIGIVVFVEKSYRSVSIVSPGRGYGNNAAKGSFIPLKINSAGVLPPIFASSVLLFPITMSGLFANSENFAIRWIFANLNHGKPLFIVLYIIAIVFFAFFYNGVVFDLGQMSKNLQKSGVMINGVRPGPNTEKHLAKILSRLALIGSVYLSIICILPEFFTSISAASVMLGGTSMLIIVTVLNDTLSQFKIASMGDVNKFTKPKVKRQIVRR